MTAIFISHSSADNRAAAQMKDWLESKGHTSLFLDFDPEAGIKGGSSWEQTLYQKLRQCQAVIALLTPNWLTSKWCFVELAQARASGKAIFPIKVQSCQADGIFSDIQCIDLTTQPEEGYRRLELGLKESGLDPLDVFDWDPKRSPYPGLLAFQEADAAIFFGRGEETLKALELLDSLRRQGGEAARFVLFLGASGSGKSSLVRAGVMPRLKKRPVEWLPVRPFRPQTDPLQELAVALGAAFDACGRPRDWNPIQTELHDAAAAEPVDGKRLLKLTQDLAIAAKQTEATVLLTIDQAEELFYYSHPDMATRFLRLLRAALEAADQRLMAIATLRSDFLGDFQNHPMLLDDEYPYPFRYQAVPVDPMPVRSFPEIIQGPARLAGLQFDEIIVDAMVRDTGTRDALPLLAFTLRRLYERYGTNGHLTVQQYDELGRLEGAVQEAAQRILTEADPTPAGREALHAAFVPALVRVNSQGSYACRRALLDELPRGAILLLRRFIAARLLVTDRDPEGRETIEVAHEALLRTWPLLGDWLAEDQDKLRLLDTLQQAAEEWDKSGRQDDLLVHRDGRLKEAEALLATPRFAVSKASVERAYLNACSAAQQAREATEKEEQERRIRDAERIAEEQKKAAAAQRKIIQRTRVGLGMALLLAMVAAIAGWIAMGQKQEARKQAVAATQSAKTATEQKQKAEQNAREATKATQVVRARRLAAEASTAIERTPQRAGLLAAEALKAADNSEDGSAKVAAEQVLQDSLANLSGIGLGGHEGPINAVAIDPMGRWLVTGSQDGTARLWDLSAGHPTREPRLLRHHKGPINAVAFGPQGRRLVTGGQDGTAVLWDLSVPDPARSARVLYGHVGPINALAIDSTGHWLATGSQDGTTRLWDLRDSNENRELLPVVQDKSERKIPITAIAFDRTGKWLAAGNQEGILLVWATDEGAKPEYKDKPFYTDQRHYGPITAIAFGGGEQGENKWLATGSQDKFVWLRRWNSKDPNKLMVQKLPHEGSVTAIAFLDGKDEWLATGSRDQIARLWRLDRKDEPEGPVPLSGHEGPITAVAFYPPLNPDCPKLWLATGSEDKTVRLWDLKSVQRELDSAQSSPDASQRMRPPIPPVQNSRVLSGHEAAINALAFDPKGQWLVTGSLDNTARLWNLLSSNLTYSARVLSGHKSDVVGIAFTPRDRLITSSLDNTARLWKLNVPDFAQNYSYTELPELEQRRNSSVYRLAIDPRGRWLVINSLISKEDHKVKMTSQLYDLNTNAPFKNTMITLDEKNLEEGRTAPITLIASDSRDKWLVTASLESGVAKLWEVSQLSNKDYKGRDLPGHKGPITAVAFDPQGRWLATGSEDRTARLWDLRDPAQNFHELPGHGDRITAVAFDPQGRWLATGSRDNTVRLWNLNAPDSTQNVLVLSGHTHWITAVAFDPQGRWLATGSEDRTARLWDLRKINPKISDPVESTHVLSGHEAAITAVGFDPQGHWLATGSRDRTARLWDLDVSKPAQRFRILRGHKGDIWTLAFDPQGRWLVTGSLDRTARIWDLKMEPSKLQSLTRLAVGRNLTSEEWNQYFSDHPYCPTFFELPFLGGETVSKECKLNVAEGNSPDDPNSPGTVSGAVEAYFNVTDLNKCDTDTEIAYSNTPSPGIVPPISDTPPPNAHSEKLNRPPANRGNNGAKGKETSKNQALPKIKAKPKVQPNIDWSIRKAE